MKKIEISYFAILRDQRGLSEESLETAAHTVKDLYGELQEAHGFDMCTSRLKVAINDEFSEWDKELNDNDRVVFIPPVAGG